MKEAILKAGRALLFIRTPRDRAHAELGELARQLYDEERKRLQSAVNIAYLRRRIAHLGRLVEPKPEPRTFERVRRAS